MWLTLLLRASEAEVGVWAKLQLLSGTHHWGLPSAPRGTPVFCPGGHGQLTDHVAFCQVSRAHPSDLLFCHQLEKTLL